MRELIEKLKDEQPEILTERIRDYSSTNNICKFAKEIYFRSSVSINIFEVNATKDHSFAGKTWLDLLTEENERKRNALFHVLNNKEYYTKPSQKALGYKRIGENLIVNVGCPYRTAVGKALLYNEEKHSFGMVELEEYLLDSAMLEVYNFLRKLLHEKGLYHPEGSSKIVPRVFSRRTDIKHGVGWATERKMPLIQLQHTKTDEKLDLTNAREVLEIITEIHSGPLLRRFRTNRYARFLR